MPETHELTDNELRLRELWKTKTNLSQQRSNVRVQKVNAEIAFCNLGLLITDTLVEIAKLERKGTKHYPEAPAEPVKNAKDKDME